MEWIDANHLPGRPNQNDDPDQRAALRRRGFTLTELLVTMAVMGVVLAAVLDVLSYATQQWGKQASYAHVVQQANLALERMEKEIHTAVSFSTRTVNGNTIYTFTLPAAADGSGNYIPQWKNGALTYGTGMQVSFYLSDAAGSLSQTKGSVLWRASRASGQASSVPDTDWSLYTAAQPRYDNMQSFSITTSGMPSNCVLISLQMAAEVGKETRSYALSRKVYLANNDAKFAGATPGNGSGSSGSGNSNSNKGKASGASEGEDD